MLVYAAILSYKVSLPINGRVMVVALVWLIADDGEVWLIADDGGSVDADEDGADDGALGVADSR